MSKRPFLLIWIVFGVFFGAGMLWSLCNTNSIVSRNVECAAQAGMSLSVIDTGVDCYCSPFVSASVTGGMCTTGLYHICQGSPIALKTGMSWSFGGYVACDSPQCNNHLLEQ